MKTLRILAGVAVGLFSLGSIQAQVTLSPLVGFGGADGWLSPGEGGYTYLGTGSLERGLAYGNNHLYLVSRNGGSHIRILDKMTGAEVGALPLGSGIISGGTFAVNTVRVAADGAIYVANLASPLNPSTFKVYRWADESSTPTVAFSSTTVTAGRLGDNFDAIGSGSSTLLVAGESNSAGSGNRNGYAVLSTSDGLNFTGSLVTFPVSPNSGFTSPGDFRLGITFTDSSHVIGTQSGSGGNTLPRYTSFAGTAGTLLGTPVLGGSTAQVIMDYAEIGGIPLLATQSSGDSTIRIWDLSDLNGPVLVASGNNTSGTLASNGNASGQMQWGDLEYDGDNGVWKAKLWTMSSNQGIQAFVVTVPEPSAATMALLGGALLAMHLVRRSGLS